MQKGKTRSCLQLGCIPITHMIISAWNNLKFLEPWFLPIFFLSFLPSFFFPFLPSLLLSVFPGTEPSICENRLWVVYMRGWQLCRIPDGLAGLLPQCQAQSALSKGVWDWIESFPRDHREYGTQIAMKSTKHSMYPFIWKYQPNGGKSQE